VAVAFKVTPTAATIATGSTATFVAQELWSDGTLHVPASTVTWTSGTTSVAKVVLVGTGTSTANLVALAVGSSVITASEANFPPVNSNLTVQAATARFAFNADNGFNVSQGGTGTLAEWSVDTTTGAFTTIAATVQVYQLQQIIVHPSGHFFYAIDVNNNFVQYDVNSTTGAVTRDTNLPVPTTNGLGVSKAAIDPTGRFVYLVNAPTVTGISASLYSFSIDQGTGALTSIGTNPMTANLVNPTDIEIDRTGAYAYVVDGGTSAANFTGSTPGNIYQYQIDPVAGTLTPLSTASVATGVAPFFAAIDPSNTYLYTANLVDVSLSVYKIGIGGLLSQVCTPTVISGAQEPFDLTIEPSGKYLYVGDFNGGTLYGFVLGPNGTIGAGTPGSPYPVGGNIPSPQPWGITIDPTGTLLAVDNVSANLLSVFQLNPMNGGLTAAPDVPTGGLPFYLSFYTASSGQ
jgi:6-phosphogluconolactonase (cycloisomerase 2 family)